MPATFRTFQMGLFFILLSTLSGTANSEDETSNAAELWCDSPEQWQQALQELPDQTRSPHLQMLYKELCRLSERGMMPAPMAQQRLDKEIKRYLEE